MNIRNNNLRSNCNFYKGEIEWESPSNIALVKYWGKHGLQFPNNPSISFSLNRSKTITSLIWEYEKDGESCDIDFLFEGEVSSFLEKIESYILKLTNLLPFLNKYKLRFSSTNTFPHSVGIASSASSMSSIALCLCSMEEHVRGEMFSDQEFYIRASQIARIGSGSACRSLRGEFSIWGEIAVHSEASDEYALQISNVNDYFLNYVDIVLLVSSNPKVISSSQGHSLMDGHFLAQKRRDQSICNASELYSILLDGEDRIDRFMEIVEEEALTLHALMLSSSRPYILLTENSLNIINAIRIFRAKTGIPVCFTIDAGPNIHLLYNKRYTEEVLSFIKSDLLNFLEQGRFIEDMVGSGPLERGLI